MSLVRTARRLLGQCHLIYRDPEKFLRNLKQVTNKAMFLDQLLDMPQIRKLDVSIVSTAEGARPDPVLNVLLPRIGRLGMTGGPNTVLLIGALLAHGGVTVRFISCDVPIESNTEWFWNHLAQLTGIPGRPAGAILQDSFAIPLQVGADDLLLASFWTTAYQAADMLAKMRRDSFIYLIQDFEPGFYPWSSRYALAAASLNLKFHAVINEQALADFLFESRVGQFSHPDFRHQCTVFEPAVDGRLFKPAVAKAARPRRLLLYARPTNPRNLLGLSVAALRIATVLPSFAKGWEFLAIGARGSLPPIPLGAGKILREAPWKDLAGYAALLQESDILLSPMLSPHTSYPVLEMAACNRIVVTNSFATKTAARLVALSPNILAVDATVDGFVQGLVAAAERVEAGNASATFLELPGTWEEALAGVNDVVRELLAFVPDAVCSSGS